MDTGLLNMFQSSSILSSYNIQPGWLWLKARCNLGSSNKTHSCKAEHCAAGRLFLLSKTVMEAFDSVCGNSRGPSGTAFM